MAILFAGGELEDFAISGAVSFSSTAAQAFRAAYSRGYLHIPGSAFNVTHARAAFVASTTLGVTARGYTGNSFSPGGIFLWLSSGGVARLRLKLSSTTPSTIVLETWNGSAATTLATSSLTVTQSTQHRFDLLVTYGVSGRVRLFVDGVLFIDHAGDVTAGGSDNLDGLHLAGHNTSSGFSSQWSEIIVADEDTRPLSLKTLVPNATGDVAGWTSGTWQDLDEATASDTDVASSGTAGQVMNMDVTGMPAGASGLSVRAVKVVASALRGASGPSKMQLGVKSGSTEGWSADIPLDTGYTSVSHTWTTNPATGQPFTAAEIEALKLALKSVA